MGLNKFTTVFPRIEFFSRKVAESIVPPENSAMISISTPGDDLAKLHPDWLKHPVHKSVFHDIDREQDYYQCFTDVQAFAMVMFIKELKEINTSYMYVHCDAGISRSAAVALYMSEYLNLYFPSSYSHFNSLVYRKLKEQGHYHA